MWKFFILLFSTHIVCGYENENTEKPPETWTGRWFPYGPGETDQNPGVSEDRFRTMMSVNPNCDDGKTNLTVDWKGTEWEHSCFMPKSFYRPNPDTHPIFKCEHIPKKYSAVHVCMDKPINYDWSIPTYGPHRPVWAAYGEYRYLPKQRWLHNLEHGAVIMLYHPCANVVEVTRLKNIVKGCLWRHIITPDRFISEERPLVLLTWGCRFEMSYVYEPLVKEFIKDHALHGPEDIHRDGLYEEALLNPAKMVSDKNDTNICPEINGM